MLPTLPEARSWFKTEVIPRRTARAGLSFNRVWKTPRARFAGNTEDPNGLCGDASLFVVEEYYRKFNDYRTSDGYHIGMVLWEGLMLNHMAAIMLRAEKIKHQTYKFSPKSGARVGNSPGQYDTSTLMKLDVFDLYYKKHTDLGSWWSAEDSNKGGTLTLGLQHDFT